MYISQQQKLNLVVTTARFVLMALIILLIASSAFAEAAITAVALVISQPLNDHAAQAAGREMHVGTYVIPLAAMLTIWAFSSKGSGNPMPLLLVGCAVGLLFFVFALAGSHLDLEAQGAFRSI